jgi:hypothetical protein
MKHDGLQDPRPACGIPSTPLHDRGYHRVISLSYKSFRGQGGRQVVSVP